jgi:hypothetical protein
MAVMPLSWSVQALLTLGVVSMQDEAGVRKSECRRESCTPILPIDVATGAIMKVYG